MSVSHLLQEAEAQLPGEWKGAIVPTRTGVELILCRLTTMEGCSMPIGIELRATGSSDEDAIARMRGILPTVMVLLLNASQSRPLAIFQARIFSAFGPFCAGVLTCPTAEEGFCACSAMLHAIAADLMVAAEAPSGELGRDSTDTPGAATGNRRIRDLQ